MCVSPACDLRGSEDKESGGCEWRASVGGSPLEGSAFAFDEPEMPAFVEFVSVSFLGEDEKKRASQLSMRERAHWSPTVQAQPLLFPPHSHTP